ncbi:hypothetical protein B0H19DRAFT_706559 [Mycena capillaripes]|nr:hypothetical protein B0H19DRAFT_706559 [Mycena capillaripes]
MGTLYAPPPGDPFKDHLIAVLCLHDGPRGAAAPVARYSGPRDWQTDAILRKVEALMLPGLPANNISSTSTHYTNSSSDTSEDDSEPTHYPADPLTCLACGHRPLHRFDSAESSGLGALEELRLLNDQVCDVRIQPQGTVLITFCVPVKGEILALKNAVNDMVLLLRTLAAEVTRLASEVGKQGRLGGQV